MCAIGVNVLLWRQNFCFLRTYIRICGIKIFVAKNDCISLKSANFAF